MLENLKESIWRFNLIILLVIFINLNSLAKDLYLNSLKISNLPDIYKDIFKAFFLENLNIYKDKGNINLDIEIKWLSLNYNICFFIHEKNKYFLESLCFTSPTAENIIDNLAMNLKNSDFLKLKKEIKKKIINLKIINPRGTPEKIATIRSTKGDILTGFKGIYYYKNQKGNFITIGGAAAVNDIVVIPENSSAFLLQKFLNGYKIDKVYLIK